MRTIESYLAQTEQHALPDGRSLAYLDLGAANGKPLIFFHGLPGSRVEAIALDHMARQYGFRLIAPDRPGMGASMAQPGRTLLEWPDDVVMLADALGWDKFGVIGVSGGGPFALACAYAVPQRLEFVLDVAGSAPLWTDASALAELSHVDRLFATIGKYLPTAFMQPPYAYMAYRLRRMEQGDDFVKLFGNAISEPDREVAMVAENGQLLVRDAQESFRQGTRAVAEETMLNYKPWGFALAEVMIPVHLFHGTEDKLVPYSFAEFKSRHLPQAIMNTLPGTGHFHLLFNPTVLFDYLAALSHRSA